MTVNKDIDVKIGTKEERAWTQIRDETEAQLENLKRGIIINENLLKLAKEMIEKEKS